MQNQHIFNTSLNYEAGSLDSMKQKDEKGTTSFG
jgi:hypothetical protein